jgi:hypothetical protein
MDECNDFRFWFIQNKCHGHGKTDYPVKVFVKVSEIFFITYRCLTPKRLEQNHDTLLAATNSVNTALGGMFMPIVSASPVGQVQLVQ